MSLERKEFREGKTKGNTKPLPKGPRPNIGPPPPQHPRGSVSVEYTEAAVEISKLVWDGQIKEAGEYLESIVNEVKAMYADDKLRGK